jgi:carbon monoxide dehydrogenase subunit G
MASYSFVTTWRFSSPIESVWETIVNSLDWPRWWPSVRSVRRLKEGEIDGVGTVDEFAFKGRLPYTLRFTMTTTRVQRPTDLEGEARGELNGKGRWHLHNEDNETVVTYYWDVSTTGLLFNLLAPLARPIFAWNHDHVMEEGRRGLARWLSHTEESERLGGT